MSMLSEIESCVQKIEKLHPNDPIVCEYWDELTKILSSDENETIVLLESLTDSVIVDNLSSVFEDVSANLQSKRFICCIESLEDKFPDLLLKHMVTAAKDALLEDE